jgi:hypothetical protein
VDDGFLDAEEVRVEVPFAHPVSDLAGKAGVEMILGNRIEVSSALVRQRIFGVERHVHRSGRDADFVDLFPGQFEVRPAGLDHAYLRIDISRAFFFAQMLCDRIVQRGSAWDPPGASEPGDHGALILADLVNPSQHDAEEEPEKQSDGTSD